MSLLKSKSARPKAFTLVEVLIFASIFVVLTGSIALVVQSGLRYMRTTSAYQDAQREALVAMQKVTGELAQGTSTHKRLPASFETIVFLTPVPQPVADWTYQDTDLEYHAWLSFYRDPLTSELVEARQELLAPTTSFNVVDFPTPADMQALPAANRRAIARHISDFQVSEGLVASQIRVVISASISTGTGKNTVVSSRSLVTMPNP